MKKVCAMASTIFNPEKPKQSFNELNAVGLHEVMFDFGLIISPEGILIDHNSEEPKFKPQKTRKSYQTIIKQFAEHGFMPSIARLPFVDVRLNPGNIYQYKELNNLICKLI